MMDISRRKFLKATGATGVVSCVGWGDQAYSQTTSPIVVGSYAGVFEEALRHSFVDHFESQSNIPVVLTIGMASQWLGQVQANIAKPPVDVIFAPPRDAVSEGKRGYIQKLPRDKLSNLKDIPEIFTSICEDWGVCFDYGALGLVYNSDRIKNPPKSFAEFINRTIAGEWTATVPSITTQVTMPALIWSLNDVLGGSIDDISPVVKAMHAMRPNLIFWNGMTDVLIQLESGEADIGIYADGRTWAHHFSGAEWIRFINPEEGAVIDPLCAMVPKNAHPNAWDFVNVLLAAEPQSRFSDITYFGMTNSKVQYSEKIRDLVTRWESGRLAPTAEIAERSSVWTERWNKEFGT